MSPTLVVDSLIADSLAAIECFSQHDVLALRHQLKRRNLPTHGLKRNLLARLLIYEHGCQNTTMDEPMSVVRARWEVVIAGFIKRSEANSHRQSELIVEFLNITVIPSAERHPVMLSAAATLQPSTPPRAVPSAEAHRSQTDSSWFVTTYSSDSLASSRLSDIDNASGISQPINDENANPTSDSHDPSRTLQPSTPLLPIQIPSTAASQPSRPRSAPARTLVTDPGAQANVNHAHNRLATALGIGSRREMPVAAATRQRSTPQSTPGIQFLNLR
ncbi:hypothetical protein V500_00053 [Pseudogymnoascus sp. VKM F-4518 (FW-2643)]|nr:hypothetical protein V500_00053 [Pseudogymnoascus sp. VKM F-4518 (FW-2643)]